jgi:hypothetical protein
MKYFIQVSLSTYIAAMLVYSLWGAITFSTIDDKGWIGSLVYLPHGCRVIFYCFFGVRALPALYLAEITGPMLVWGDQYLDYWTFASLISLGSVVIAVEILKWSRVATWNYSILGKINFSNYKFIIFVIIISALFNSIFTNLFLSIANGIELTVFVVFRFFIGDMAGSVCFIAFLIIMFNLLRAKKYYPVHDD